MISVYNWSIYRALNYFQLAEKEWAGYRTTRSVGIWLSYCIALTGCIIMLCSTIMFYHAVLNVQRMRFFVKKKSISWQQKWICTLTRSNGFRTQTINTADTWCKKSLHQYSTWTFIVQCRLVDFVFVFLFGLNLSMIWFKICVFVTNKWTQPINIELCSAEWTWLLSTAFTTACHWHISFGRAFGTCVYILHSVCT